MNFIITIVLTAVAQYFLPWWTIAVVPFAIHAALPVSASNAFWESFVAVVLVWGGYAGYLHYISAGAMSGRIAQLFSLGDGLVLVAITALVGGLVGGFSGLSGLLCRRLFQRPQPVA